MTKLLLAALAATTLAAPLARADELLADPPQPQAPTYAPEAAESRTSAVISDIKAYYTAPLHWDAGDWAWFGGSLVAIGAAHHFDTQVRTHFIKTEGATVGKDTKDVEDFAPTAVVLAGTWLYASLIDDSAGRTEAWTMLEAAGLGGVTGYALKFAAGRQRPNETSDPNKWREGGSSFPSFHSTAAFAVGTVLAESGNDDYRWIRRLLGYGLGVGTSYERLKHNSHWLSDTVAGAALGIASAHFAMHRNEHRLADSGFGVVPLAGGAMLTYSVTFP